MTSGARINKRTFWYLPYIGKERLKDEYLNYTGEERIIYGEAVECKGNISPASGLSQTEMFGNLDSYDKVISPLPNDFQITENDVLFIDKSPEYDDDNNPLYDYKVKRIARSLNYTAVAVAKVDVS